VVKALVYQWHKYPGSLPLAYQARPSSAEREEARKSDLELELEILVDQCSMLSRIL